MEGGKKTWKGAEETNMVASDEWYTPEHVVRSFGRFDCDPCAALSPTFRTAGVMYNKFDDGLTKEWVGRVWLNPPYSKDLLEAFVKKLASHGNGIALLFNRCDNVLFHDVILKNATAVKFLRKRIHFLKPDGSSGSQPASGSIAVAFGKENVRSLEASELEGTVVYLYRDEQELSKEVRQLPLCINDEKQLLSSILEWDYPIAEIKDYLKSASFFDYKHQVVYNIMLHCHKKGVKITRQIVETAIEQSDLPVGVANELAEYVRNVLVLPPDKNYEQQARKILHCAVGRQFFKIADEISRKKVDKGCLEELQDKLNRLIGRMEKIEIFY